MKRKIQFGAAFISAVLLLAVTGCGSSKEELPPTEEGQEALQNASVLTMTGSRTHSGAGLLEHQIHHQHRQ